MARGAIPGNVLPSHLATARCALVKVATAAAYKLVRRYQCRAYRILSAQVPLSVVDGRLSKVMMTFRRDDSDDHPVRGETHRLPRRAPVSPSSPATEDHAPSSRSWPTWN